MPAMRRTPRPRLRRWTEAHRSALLHERSGAEVLTHRALISLDVPHTSASPTAITSASSRAPYVGDLIGPFNDLLSALHQKEGATDPDATSPRPCDAPRPVVAQNLSRGSLGPSPQSARLFPSPISPPRPRDRKRCPRGCIAIATSSIAGRGKKGTRPRVGDAWLRRPGGRVARHYCRLRRADDGGEEQRLDHRALHHALSRLRRFSVLCNFRRNDARLPAEREQVWSAYAAIRAEPAGVRLTARLFAFRARWLRRSKRPGSKRLRPVRNGAACSPKCRGGDRNALRPPV